MRFNNDDGGRGRRRGGINNRLPIRRAKAENNEQKNQNADNGERAQYNDGNAKPAVARQRVVPVRRLFA
ncbi:MAG: hypothetical protein B6D41_16300 [Chloroflexi bacterium UTCFX4]|nr:MAG: hypothetical protein B6D41_16300 [Chloroflexi bacterium UTCFX4]